MPDVAGIVSLFTSRSNDQQASTQTMLEFERYLKGDIEIALPEIGGNERAAIANLASQGLEQMALRAASTMPDVKCPPIRAEGDKQKTAERRARVRRQAALGWWDANSMDQVLTLRAEYLFAHGAAPVTVLPDPVTKIPTWRVRSPLECFPAPMFNPLDITPRNVVFTHMETFGNLKDRYGSKVYALKRPKDFKDDSQIQVLEYMDHKEIVWVARSPQASGSGIPSFDIIGTDNGIELDRVTNKAGVCLAFVPGWARVIGNRGRFGDTIGAHQMRAKLLALAYLTAYKAAMPDTWAESDGSGKTPEVVSTPDPRTGEIGIIEGGKLKTYAPESGYMTSPMLSILEREIRLGGGIPAEFGGEATSNVRTGRRGDQVLGASIDYPIQKAHRIFERSLEAETKAAFAIVKNWTPGPKSFYVNYRNAKGHIDYNPAEDFDTDELRVVYSMAGTDLAEQTIRLGQKVGVGQLSTRTAMEMDPEIPDAELERDRVNSEKIEAIAFQMLNELVAAGTIGPDELQDIFKAIRDDKLELIEAVGKAQKQMQERQEEQMAQAPAEPAAPGMGPPGLVPGPTDDMSNFRATLGALYPAQAQMGV